MIYLITINYSPPNGGLFKPQAYLLRLVQIALQYTLPELKQETDGVEDLTLFVD
jgi:hypothetical protein